MENSGWRIASTYIESTYFGDDVRIMATYVFWRRTYFGDVRISGDNTFGDGEQGFRVRTLENTLDSEDPVEEERLGLVYHQP